ncbi:MAG: RnfH family protein [Burkholderiales bacterium]|nr:RnfH family protein [Burkholderiales bacterium]
MAEGGLEVTVVWAAPGVEDATAVRLPPGATIADAIVASGISARHAGVDAARVGVWGHLRARSDVLAPGDRIEVYRPLTADPQAARQRRAQKKKAAPRP